MFPSEIDSGISPWLLQVSVSQSGSSEIQFVDFSLITIASIYLYRNLSILFARQLLL